MELDKIKGERMEKDKKTTPQDHGLRIGQKVRLIQKVLAFDGEKRTIQDRVKSGKVVSIYPYIFGVRWKDARYIEYFGAWILNSTGAERIEAK